MQPDDQRFSKLLHAWRGVEPQANFEASVWRRIRIASVPEPRRIFTISTLRDWLVARPAWASAMATAAGIAVGVCLAFSSVSAMRAGQQSHEPLLNPRTLAGSYLTLLTEVSR